MYVVWSLQSGSCGPLRKTGAFEPQGNELALLVGTANALHINGPAVHIGNGAEAMRKSSQDSMGAGKRAAAHRALRAHQRAEASKQQLSNTMITIESADLEVVSQACSDERSTAATLV